jgi:GNAT superfamily N-acetyltransferase
VSFAEEPGAVSVEQVRVEVTWPLRAEILRPGRSPREVPFAGELDPRAGHFAAFADNRVVGVAAVLPEPEPDGPKPTGAWRLRGMAVAPAARGRGIGRLLLERVRDHVARTGGGQIWCNARVSAQGFYAAEGWTAIGEPWDEPEIGPHIRMHDTR